MNPMHLCHKTIFTGFAPNLTRRDVNTALRFLCFPWLWSKLQQGEMVQQFETMFARYHATPHAMAFDSGRTALFAAFQALGVHEGHEVAVQAYTCVVVSSAIQRAKATPVYIDIDDAGNMDPLDLEKKITSQTKVLIIQHTFGVPAQMDKLQRIALRHGLRIIEDCAHALGARYRGQLVGTFADIGMFSFGSDKVISCVRGGALITHDQDLALRLERYQKSLPLLPRRLIIQHLLHYPFFFLGKQWYHIGLGKALLALGKKLYLFSRIITPAEKRGDIDPNYPTQLPNALAWILLDQFRDLERVNTSRRRIAAMYNQKITNAHFMLPCHRGDTEPIFLRYLLRVKDPTKVRREAKKKGLLLGDWYTTVIAPADSSLRAAGYTTGDCPKAEALARSSLNLPTDASLTDHDVERIITWINEYGSSSHHQ